MSLRAEITDALDEVITPSPVLERTVTAFVFANARDRKVLKLRRRRASWSISSRGFAAMVAVALVLAIIGGLIVGGRLLRDLHGAPAPAINQGELKKLEARPLLTLPAMPSDGVCPAGPVAENFMGGYATGDGPMRLILGYPVTMFRTTWGTWTQTYFLVRPTTKGLFLVRARDLKSGETVYFAGNLSGIADAQFGRAIVGGVVAGQDHVNGQRTDLHPELVINASAPSDFVKTPTKPPLWGAYVGYSGGASGCISFQVDYDNAPAETFVYAY
jgi:hypothetical protein